MTRAALYARAAGDVGELRRHARARGFAVAGEYLDAGGRTRQRDAMLADLRAGGAAVVLVRRLDELEPDVRRLVVVLDEVRSLGATVATLDGFDSSAPGVAYAIGALAAVERERMRARILARRPRVPADMGAVLDDLAAGVPRAEAAKRHGVDPKKLARFVRAVRRVANRKPQVPR
jgi:resolvase-like protein